MWDHLGLIIWSILLIFQIYNMTIDEPTNDRYITSAFCIFVIFLYVNSIFLSKRNKNVKK